MRSSGHKSVVEREEWPAFRFMLATLGRDRGFTERTEASSPTAKKGIGTLGADLAGVAAKIVRHR